MDIVAIVTGWLSGIDWLYPVVQGLLAAHALALFIVNLTPTPTDNTIVATLYQWIEYLAGIVTPAAKDTGTSTTPPTSG